MLGEDFHNLIISVRSGCKSMALQKWNEIQAGSKVKLSSNGLLKGFNGEYRAVLAGEYYIVGFYADMVGLSKRLSDVHSGLSQLFIQSRELVAFDNLN